MRDFCDHHLLEVDYPMFFPQLVLVLWGLGEAIGDERVDGVVSGTSAALFSRAGWFVSGGDGPFWGFFPSMPLGGPPPRWFIVSHLG